MFLILVEISPLYIPVKRRGIGIGIGVGVGIGVGIGM